MKKFKLFFILTLMFTLFFLLFVNSSFSATFNWKVSGGWAPNALESQTIDLFVDLVNKRSNEEIKLTHFPAKQLGDSLALLEMLETGALEVNVDTSSWHTRLMPEWEVLSFPYTIIDNEHLKRVQESEWFNEIKERYYEEWGIKIIANNGYRLPRHLLHVNKGIISPEDIVGVKLRKADAKIWVKPWQDFGADVTIIPWTEAAVSLVTGLIEACGAPAQTIYPEKFYEGAPHITLTGHQRDTVDITVSRIHWEKLSPELQQIMISSAKEALDWFTSELDKTWEEHKELMSKSGVIFYEADIEAWKKKASEIAKKWEEEGEWPKGLFEKIQNM